MKEPQRRTLKELREARNLVIMTYATLERARSYIPARQRERQLAVTSLLVTCEQFEEQIMGALEYGVVRSDDGDAAGDVG